MGRKESNQTNKISAAEETGLSLTLLETPRTGFVASMPIIFLHIVVLYVYRPHPEKTCLGVSDKARFKPACSATETS